MSELKKMHGGGAPGIAAGVFGYDFSLGDLANIPPDRISDSLLWGIIDLAAKSQDTGKPEIEYHGSLVTN